MKTTKLVIENNIEMLETNKIRLTGILLNLNNNDAKLSAPSKTAVKEIAVKLRTEITSNKQN